MEDRGNWGQPRVGYSREDTPERRADWQSGATSRPSAFSPRAAASGLRPARVRARLRIRGTTGIANSVVPFLETLALSAPCPCTAPTIRSTDHVETGMPLERSTAATPAVHKPEWVRSFLHGFRLTGTANIAAVARGYWRNFSLVDEPEFCALTAIVGLVVYATSQMISQGWTASLGTVVWSPLADIGAGIIALPAARNGAAALFALGRAAYTQGRALPGWIARVAAEGREDLVRDDAGPAARRGVTAVRARGLSSLVAAARSRLACAIPTRQAKQAAPAEAGIDPASAAPVPFEVDEMAGAEDAIPEARAVAPKASVSDPEAPRSTVRRSRAASSARGKLVPGSGNDVTPDATSRRARRPSQTQRKLE
jgi:hypothetical protein